MESRAALYLRVSTEAQATKDLSLPAQEKDLRDLCKSKGWTIVRVFKEPGVSGTTDQRPQFQRMFAEALKKEPPFSIVVCYSVDRFGRSEMDTVNARKMRDNGVRLFCKLENIFADENRLSFGIHGLMGQAYSDRLREVVPRGQRQAVRQGGLGTGRDHTFGYRVKREFDMSGRTKSHLVPDPETAPLVRKLFERYASGESCAGLANWLNSNKIPTQAQRLGKPPRGRTHGLWLQATIRSILRNPVYTGYVFFGRRTDHKGLDGKVTTTKNDPSTWTRSDNQTHKALVSEEVFQAVRDRLNSNEQTRPREGRPANILFSIGKCKACGSSLSFEDNGPRNGSKYYYFCRGHRRHKQGDYRCSGGIRMEAVDEEIGFALAFVFEHKGALKKAVSKYNRAVQSLDISEELTAARERVSRVERELHNLVRAVEAGGDIPALVVRLNGKQEELEAARESLAGFESEVRVRVQPLDENRVATAFNRVQRAFKNGKREELARLLSSIVSEVTIDFTIKPYGTVEHFKGGLWGKHVKDRSKFYQEPTAVSVVFKYDLANLDSIGKEALQRVAEYARTS